LGSMLLTVSYLNNLLCFGCARPLDIFLAAIIFIPTYTIFVWSINLFPRSHFLVHIVK